MTSIANNLNRITDTKTAIREAIAQKGVSVPETTLISDYHTYIDQIGS